MCVSLSSHLWIRHILRFLVLYCTHVLYLPTQSGPIRPWPAGVDIEAIALEHRVIGIWDIGRSF